MDTITLPAPQHTFSDEDIKNKLGEKDLDFTVGKIATKNPVPGHKTEDSGFYTSYRTDTGHCFQTGLTKRWEPIQNHEVFRCLADLSKETEAKLVNLRSFKNGAEIAAQISLSEGSVGSDYQGKKDRVSNYLSVLFSHNGERSLSMYMTPIRWGCDNMINPSFRAARAQEKKGIKAIMTIQHSQNAHEKLKDLMSAVTIAHGEFQYSMDLYSTLKETKVNQDLIKQVVEKYFPIPEEATKRMMKSWQLKMHDISNRYVLADKGLQPVDSAWNVYNAVQGHIQHYTARNKGIVSEASEKSTLIGSNETMAAQVLRTVIELSIGMGSLTPSPLSTRTNKAYRANNAFA